jgi:hypothetical protein
MWNIVWILIWSYEIQIDTVVYCKNRKKLIFSFIFYNNLINSDNT